MTADDRDLGTAAWPWPALLKALRAVRSPSAQADKPGTHSLLPNPAKLRLPLGTACLRSSPDRGSRDVQASPRIHRILSVRRAAPARGAGGRIQETRSEERV